MRRLRLIVFALVTSFCAHAADGRMAFLKKQLEKGKDPRLRSQAALLLGASGEAEALKPLCGALADPDAVVRSAAARALEALADPKGVACLQARANDPDPAAKASIAKSLGALKGLAGKKPTLYVSLPAVESQGGAVAADVLTLAHDRLRAGLAAKGAALAPEGEAKAAAHQVMKARKLKGYYVRVRLEPVGNSLKLNLLCFTYPENALLGEVNVKASGARPADLVKALVPRALDEAAETFDWSL
jgi:hypothetical protein